MTTASWTLLGMAALVAACDWVAVAVGNRPGEYICKPLTMVLIVAVALTLTPTDGLRRAYIVAAAVLSLGGDVCLMLPGARAKDATPEAPRQKAAPDVFTIGLGLFLIAHVDYIAAFTLTRPGPLRALIGVGAVLPVALPLAGVIVRSMSRTGNTSLRVPVVAYMAVVAGMVAMAIASGSVVAMTGAWLFLASDGLLGWDRFVARVGWSPVAVAATYHLAQALLVLSLLT